ncbi:MAG: hypothetical protein LH702_16900 [Phormidesmis sp. CAN_BIN44]|nr:hypothetical protein [Phormidesmis sp. CAN_BIN44]
MSSDLNKEEIAIAAISDLIKNKEIEVENIGKRLEVLKNEIFSLQETKKILSASRNNTSSGELVAASDNQTANDNQPDTLERRGTPEDWLFPQFKPLGSKKAIEQILEEIKAPVEIEDLVKALYDTKSDDEFRRARNSLSAGLRRGAEEGFWKKIGRSFYEANSVKLTSNGFRHFATDVLASIGDYDLDSTEDQHSAEYDSTMPQKPSNTEFHNTFE